MLMPSLTRADLAADNTWTSVLRVSSSCIMDGNHQLQYSDGEPFTEGKNRGWPGDAGKAAYSFYPTAASHRSRWPYGCWFYLVRSAGVFVNVGHSLRAATRRDVHRQLGIPCAEQEDPYCTRPPGDKLYCHLARERGYDSIQIASSHFNRRPEMIVCTGKCGATAVRTACPPVPLRSPRELVSGSLPARRACKCDKRSALMNCGFGGSAEEEPVNCSVARPARAVLWHQACEKGLYPRCIGASSVGG
tara:strand:- start:1052 stop:1792 length:741 start_codon:yes stop_codon:yes gene_type:complete